MLNDEHHFRRFLINEPDDGAGCFELVVID